jgi:hypothetical protein
MISAFAPIAVSTGQWVRRKTREELRLAWCVLAAVVLLEFAMHFLRDAMLLTPMQASITFKRISGYTMLTLMAFAMAFGWLRRRPALAQHARTLHDVHQFAGLCLLLLLALHVGRSPSGFLLGVFHAMAVGTAAGALRPLVPIKLGRGVNIALLVTHIAVSCLVSAAALLHVWWVYVYAYAG